MAKCKTYINGFFFEYDCEGTDNINQRPVEGITYQVVEDLATEPVTKEFFKQHARIDFDTDDNLLESYLKASRQELERYCQLSFGDKKMRLLALRLPKNYRLMYGHVREITSPADLTLFGDIVKDGNGEDVVIEYETSWDQVGGLPESIKIAICQYAAGMYIHRENIITELTVFNLYDQAKKSLDRYRNVYMI
jgi:hypothetical protein